MPYYTIAYSIVLHDNRQYEADSEDEAFEQFENDETRTEQLTDLDVNIEDAYIIESDEEATDA